MPTPPSSDLAQSTPTRSRRRSPKRPRQDDSPSEQSIGHDGLFDDNQTPTGPARTLQMRIPTRPLSNPPILAPSSSASIPSSRSRSSSPVKRATLELLKKPVFFVPIKKAQLQDNMHETYERIFDITDGNEFIPKSVQDDMKASHDTIRGRWFFDHPEEETSAYKNELATLREIQEAAISRQRQGASESAWNVDVHGPLLKLALKPFESLKREILTHASISKPFVPEMRTESYYDMTKSKMIDWGITIRPSGSTAQHISKVLDTLPHHKRSINQTIYGPVRDDPIAVSIETKIASGLIEEARGQLGLWVAAWHQRMTALRTSDEQIITLPLILVMEHEWKLMFACDQGNAIHIAENIIMGETRDLVGMYRIVGVLRALASWIETEYAAWLDRWLGLGQPLADPASTL
ncbi:exostosin 3 [Fusarium albosuccineum]|uniref:Exostosin 3 n=1 Tax=Fusarium albosuccineum TaxID=1237068 RepID=A0A8H4PME8_9HYPO|nr:exostosin 3 [Fusarium albosuccineum]